MEKQFTHFDAKGNAIMVDVTEKQVTQREAIASGKIQISEAVLKAITSGNVTKGDVLGVARVAGIMAAKRTWELIPMCHPLMLTKCTIDFNIDEKACMIEATCLVKVSGQTGVEMEALTGVNVALLTIYDMCKAIDKGMVISDIKLLEKQGGKSGHYIRSEKQCVFAVSGIKNSGKTTLITKLVSALTQKGYKVGVIKHDGHEFKADHEGTDSYKHKEAGAKNVIVYSKTKVMMIKDDVMPEIESLIKLQQDMDIVILEGMKHSQYPKIEIVRSDVSTQSVCQKETLLALVTDTALIIEGIPSIHLNDFEKIFKVILDYIHDDENGKAKRKANSRLE